MVPLAARFIPCLTSVALEKFESSEKLSQMARDGPGEGYTLAADMPLGTRLDTRATGRVLTGSKSSSGGCSLALVEETHDRVLQ